MKRWITLIIPFLFVLQVQARQTASHAIRIVILQPNQFEVSPRGAVNESNSMGVNKTDPSRLTLNWRTSSKDKRITVAALGKGGSGSLKMKLNKNDTNTLTVDESHKELTDHLTDRQGKLQLQWIADGSDKSVNPSGIVYTLTDSL